MKNRTTFSLDDISIKRLRYLAKVLHISQAEVVRRALEKAEQEFKQTAIDPIQQLEEWHKKPGFEKTTAAEYLIEVAEGRADWGRKK
ncbi:MAG: ribbon-helix-helix protein, CopG family [Spirochaetales bacterium]|nr:ribbon-helix-helix protein, CopG family [Spirochaetales bacterium]